MAIEKFKMQFVNETQGFTILLTQVIQSIKELDVLGLYVYLASKPPSWKPHPKELIEHTKYSKDKIYRLINRLIELKLLSSKEIRNKGKFSYFEYTLHLSPCPEKPDTVKPDTENQDAYKIKNIENIDNINKTLAHESEKPVSTYPETYYQTPEETKQHLSEQKESDESFEAFWSMYPVKKGRQRAKVAWFSSRSYKHVHMILTKLDEQIHKDRQFIEGYPPHPTTYINNKGWEDEITPQRKSIGIAKQSSPDWAKDLHLDII